MSGHIYLDLGMLPELQRDNREAVADDRAYAVSSARKVETLDYFFHNLDFYTGGSLLLGDHPEAALGTAAFLNAGNPNAMLALDREQRFRDVLAAIPKPSANASASYLARWHYARGIAYVSLGQLDAAQAELAAFVVIPPNAGPYTRPFIQTLISMLDARLSYASGRRADAVDELRSVVAQITEIPPEAFPSWYFPAGEWLGWMLLGTGDGAGAEAAFRADLARTPHNPRSLFGLMRALSAQDRTSAGDAYALEIARNWRSPVSDLRDRL